MLIKEIHPDVSAVTEATISTSCWPTPALTPSELWPPIPPPLPSSSQTHSKLDVWHIIDNPAWLSTISNFTNVIPVFRLINVDLIKERKIHLRKQFPHSYPVLMIGNLMYYEMLLAKEIKFPNHIPWDVWLRHDDGIKWKHFPRYRPFVRGIHWSPVNSPQWPVTRSFDVFFDLHLNKQLSKQSRGWWFETWLARLTPLFPQLWAGLVGHPEFRQIYPSSAWDLVVTPAYDQDIPDLTTATVLSLFFTHTGWLKLVSVGFVEHLMEDRATILYQGWF